MTSTSHSLVWTKGPAATPLAPRLAVAGEATQIEGYQRAGAASARGAGRSAR